jgi:hypothetical protein
LKKELDAKIARQTAPSQLANPNAEATEIPKGDRSLLERAADAVKGLVSSGPVLKVDSLGRVVQVEDESTLQPHEQHLFHSKFTVHLARTMKREAVGRLRQAEQAVQVHRERLSALRAIAKQDGVLDLYDAIDTPAPPMPAKPELTRVRGLRPWSRIWQSMPSAEYLKWHAANSASEFTPAERRYSFVGLGHVVDIPTLWLDELVAAGMCEVVDPKTPKQLPNGTLLP